MTTRMIVRSPKMYQAGLYIVAAAVGGAVTAAVAQVSPFASLWVFWGMMVAGYIVAMMGRGPDADDVESARVAYDAAFCRRETLVVATERGHFELTRTQGDEQLHLAYYVGSLGLVTYAELDRIAQLRAAAMLLTSIRSTEAREAQLVAYQSAGLAIDLDLRNPKK